MKSQLFGPTFSITSTSFRSRTTLPLRSGRKWACSRLFLDSFTGACVLIAAGIGGLSSETDADEWRFVHPLPQGNDLHGVWAAAVDDVFVGGDGGTICHWDGVSWTAMTTPTTKAVYSIHGLSSDDIWAVGGDMQTEVPGDRAAILHFDGTDWTEFPAPTFGGWTYQMSCVHAIAPDDVLATLSGNSSLAHWDGSAWSLINLPLAVHGEFTSIDSVNADHVFVAGSHGQIVHRDQGVWKLEQQTESGSFSTNLLQSVWAHALDTVRVAGNFGQVYGRNTDGTWVELDLASGCTGWGCENAIFIGGAASDDLYLAGTSNVRHHDGSAPPIHRDDYASTLRGGWTGACMADDTVYLVGAQGVVHEYVFDSDTQAGRLSSLCAGEYALNGMRQIGAAGYGDHGFLVFGNTQNTTEWPLQIYDGTGFTPFPILPDHLPTGLTIPAISVAAPDDIVADFVDYSQPTFYWGSLHWDGTSWSMMGTSSQNPHVVVDYWRDPADNGVHALVATGVVRFDGTDWITVAAPGDVDNSTLSCIWGRSGDDLFLGSEEGRIWHYNGSAWSEESITGASGPIAAIAGTASEAYAVGAAGVALYRNSAATWIDVAGLDAVPGSGDFVDAIASATAIHACESAYSGGRIWLFSSGQASLVRAGLSTPIEAFARTDLGALYGIGSTNGTTTILGDAAAPADLTMQRLDLSSTEWSMIGTTGISLRPESPGETSPMVAAWSVPEAAGFLPDGDDNLGANRRWAVLADKTMLPPLFGRFELNPADWPAQFNHQAASLCRHGISELWAIVATSVGSSPPVLETTAPVEFSSWTYLSSGSESTAVLRIESIVRHANGTVDLEWTDLGAGASYTVFSAGDLDGGWSPAAGTWPTTGTSWSDSSAGGEDRGFYRVEATAAP